jgi:hypothetical protein
MRDWIRSASMARRSRRPGASKWRCPEYSSKVRGRIREARGATDMDRSASNGIGLKPSGVARFGTSAAPSNSKRFDCDTA